MPLAITQKNLGKRAKAAIFFLIDHSKLEPEPILGGRGDKRHAAPRGLELAHKFIQCKFKRIDSQRMKHMRVVDRLQMITMCLREPRLRVTILVPGCSKAGISTCLRSGDSSQVRNWVTNDASRLSIAAWNFAASAIASLTCPVRTR